MISDTYALERDLERSRRELERAFEARGTGTPAEWCGRVENAATRVAIAAAHLRYATRAPRASELRRKAEEGQ